MQCSGLQVAAFLVLLAGTILIAISIGTSSWSKKSIGGALGGISGEIVMERGLWYECKRVRGSFGDLKGGHDDCKNRYEQLIEKAKKIESGDDVQSFFKELKAWEVAVLALMCGSGLLGILSLLFSPCCCNRCGCCLATFIFFAASLCASGVCTYAYYVAAGDNDPEAKLKEFGWSFWCAVAGGACQLFSGILFSVSRCRQHSYSHTI